MENGKKRFDGKLLVENPLLQSLYAETLRIYVTILYLRKTLRDAELDGKTIPAGSTIMCCNWSQQMSEEVWNPEGRPDIPPANEFWGKRFLEYPDGDETKTPRFKAEDISGGRWFPFSMGEHICPGRNAAKREIILMFAVLATYFEVELAEGVRKPRPDMEKFGYGTMPPEGRSACRIRRRVG
jgi:cytochrome P450